MNILLLGGSGFIGKALSAQLIARGDTVFVPTRTPKSSPGNGPHFVVWNGRDPAPLVPLLEKADAVVNLLGENIAQGRWTPEQKARILNSRLDAGTSLIRALEQCVTPPHVLIQASATGYYGAWPDATSAPACTENSPAGQGFLAETARQWEHSTRAAERMGIRRCIIRTAPVLGRSGGLLSRILPPFRYGLGGPVGSGKQPFPWIHLDDEAAAILFLMDNDLNGPFNLVAPETCTSRDFAGALGAALHRPAWLSLPALLLRLALGDMADELLLAGQRAIPERLVASGFRFRYPTLTDALHHILSPEKGDERLQKGA